jgi:hypothetical protein
MQIELSRDEAEILRDVLTNEVKQLDNEINHTDSRTYKDELRDTDRTIASILGRITAALGSLATVALLMTGCARANDPTPGPLTDASITAAVKTRLFADNFTPALHISVATKDRVVTLTGKVKSRDDETEAVRVARAVGGVQSVRDQLEIHQNF